MTVVDGSAKTNGMGSWLTPTCGVVQKGEDPKVDEASDGKLEGKLMSGSRVLLTGGGAGADRRFTNVPVGPTSCPCP